ncbi:uncharacterized protein LOC120207116 [Hibiscus syriacus]|uniref:uncharacterized protein LOC120207116 n=1 Tax=Hibiscus syriacus TaxID=106335 RepID=UPI001924DD59|nr:uncharacterized protein LOC120207116 [Hibiscus syriacus]
MYGLRLNASKTEIFIAGVNGNNRTLVHEATGFIIGCLPVRYLGVPLVPRKLTENDCVVLVEKIKAKLVLWSNRWLSYAGRLQLVKAVLFSIANFWCRQLILPAAVIRRVDQLCARFFSKGGDIPAKGARELLTAEGSLWVAWVRSYVLKGANFWSIESKASFSWSMRKILKTRRIATSVLRDHGLGQGQRSLDMAED